MCPLTYARRERYARQIILPEIGEEGQERLLGSSALVVGLGGLGCPVCMYLAAAGVGRMGLADADTVSISNLQRQTLYGEAQVGLPKTEAAAMRLRALSAGIDLRLVPEGLTPANARELTADYDLVVDCTDNWRTRFLIDDVCRGEGVPWVFGSIGEWAGMVSLMNGHARRALVDVFPDRAELEARGAASGGVIGALPGIMGAAQACAAMQYLATGKSPLDGRLWIFDAASFKAETVEI